MESITIPIDFNFERPITMARDQLDPEAAIDHILDLIVFTPTGACVADPEFGFEYWNHEFANINIREFNNYAIGFEDTSCEPQGLSRQQCEESLRTSIIAYVPNLLSPIVKVELEPILEVRHRKRKSKYTMNILISGSIPQGLGVNRQYEKKISFMVEPIARH